MDRTRTLRDGGTLVGVVHLPPLPGSPRYAGSMDRIVEAGVSDALLLARSGFAAVLVENYGDVPFHREEVPPVTVASLARILAGVRRVLPTAMPLGVNVLRNDARAAVSLAAACELDFFRVNVHVGAVLADQGIVEGRAAETLRLRAALGSRALLLADVRVKHAAPLAEVPVEREARDAVERGLADILLVTGPATGEPTDLDCAARVGAAVPVPVFVASGVTARTVRDALRVAHGVVVGSAVKKGGRAGARVDAARARDLVRAARRTGARR